MSGPSGAKWRGNSQWLSLLAAIALLSVTAARLASCQPTSTSWRVTATPYLWLAGLGGQVGIGNLATNIDVSFPEVLDHLKFGAMAAFDARKGQLVLDADLVYVAIGGSKAYAFRGASGSVSFDQRETILQGAVGFSPIVTPMWTVDMLLGARFWDLNAELGLDPTNLASRAKSGNRDWVDGTGGIRVHFNPAMKWHLVADGDGGAGGAHNTWRAEGTATYDLSSRWGLIAGYKHLAVDYHDNGFLFDTQTKGALLGGTYTF